MTALVKPTEGRAGRGCPQGSRHRIWPCLRSSLGKLPPSSSGLFPTTFSTLWRDLAGGSISALITLSFSLSFAAMIFAGELSSSLGYGIGMALTSASITVMAVALLSPFRFAIAGPDSRSAAVQSALASSLAAGLSYAGAGTGATGGTSHAPTFVLLALSLSTAVTGVALYACGRLKMGRWIRYVPYPVIGGFLASTGWMLIIGGIRVVTSKPVALRTMGQMAQPEVLVRLGTGVAFTLVMLIVLQRFKHYLVLPVLLIAGNALAHVLRAALGVSLVTAQRTGWMLEVAGAGKLWLPLREVRWSLLHEHLPIAELRADGVRGSLVRREAGAPGPSRPFVISRLELSDVQLDFADTITAPFRDLPLEFAALKIGPLRSDYAMLDVLCGSEARGSARGYSFGAAASSWQARGIPIGPAAHKLGAAGNTPVTLKFRTGWNKANKNAATVARVTGTSTRRHEAAKKFKSGVVFIEREWLPKGKSIAIVLDDLSDTDVYDRRAMFFRQVSKVRQLTALRVSSHAERPGN